MTLDAYAELEDFRLYLRADTDPEDPDDNDPQAPIMELALDAASRSVDRFCGRTFREAAVTTSDRFYTVDGRPGGPYGWRSSWYVGHIPRATVSIGDLFDDTGLAVDFDTAGDGSFSTAASGFYLAPRDGPSLGKPWTQIVFDAGIRPPTHPEAIRVGALWGWPAIPPTVVNATMLQAKRYYERRDAAFGIAGSPETGSEVRLLAVLDADVKVMLRAFRRVWGAV